VARHRDPDGVYTASVAGERARVRTLQRRRHRQLGPGTVLFGVVEHCLREAWSPEPIAGTLRNCYPTDPAQRVSHETLYQALYGLPRGAVLRSAWLGCLRQGRTTRRRRARGQDRRGQIVNMTPIQARPRVIEDRVAPGHGEGDLIKGSCNRSALGTLVERTSRLVRLVKLESATALATLAGFSVKEISFGATAGLTGKGHAAVALSGQALAGAMKLNLVRALIQRGALR
jgi:IS30 family transposase